MLPGAAGLIIVYEVRLFCRVGRHPEMQGSYFLKTFNFCTCHRVSVPDRAAAHKEKK